MVAILPCRIAAHTALELLASIALSSAWVTLFYLSTAIPEQAFRK
jgi:hypothetical protein